MIGVLFMQSQTFAGADTMMHAQIMRYLDPSVFAVHVACNRDDDPNFPLNAYAVLRQIPGVRAVQVGFGPSLEDTTGVRRLLKAGTAPGMARGLFTLARYVRRNNIRIIHCTEKPRDAINGLALARMTGAKCVIHLHVKWETWINPMVRWSMRQADAVIGVSEFVARTAVEQGGCSPERVHGIVNGLDLAQWDAAADGSSVRAAYNVPQDVPLLGIVSRLFIWKGHLELLRALAPLKQRGLDFRLLIVGEDDSRGAPGRPPFSSEIRALARDLDLEDRVIFTGWRRDVPHVMAAIDIFAMPTFEEPCGVVFLEAMASRRPVVTLRGGGAPEVVEHGRTGLLAEPGDIAGLSANIETLLRDAGLRRAMGAQGRAAVEQRLNAAMMTRRVEQIYQALAAPASMPSGRALPSQ